MSPLVRGFSAFGRAVAYLFFRIFYRLQRVGVDHIPDRGGVLLVANHASFLDPPLLQVFCPRLVVFTPRTTLTESRLYRVLTALCALVPVRRGEADLEAIRRVVELLRSGHVVALFPEETRSRDGRLGPLKPGFHLLARRAGVPVVPIGIRGAHAAWPRQRRLPRLTGRIVVEAGPPLDLAATARGEALARVQDELRRLTAAADTPEHRDRRTGGSSHAGGPERRTTPTTHP